MKPLQPGECNHRVAFDEPMTTQADNGEEVVEFVEAFQLWSKVEPLNGRERTQAGQVIAEGSTRIRFYWSPNAARVNAKWRARHRGVAYNISGPPAEIDMGRREFEIMATFGVNIG